MKDYKWTASRERDNFYYTCGQRVFFDRECRNSLVISDRTNGEIKGISNTAIITKGKTQRIIPIFKTGEIFYEGLKVLGGGIHYLKPASIIQRENLSFLSEEEILSCLTGFYGFSAEETEKIRDITGKNKVYLIQTKKKKYVLKYRKKPISEIEAEFLESGSFFPKLIRGKNGLEANIGESLYTLEEFLPGVILLREKEGYFSLVGKNVALMHNEFNRIVKETKGLESYLEEKSLFNESNLISMNLDLSFLERIKKELKDGAYAVLRNDFLRKIPFLYSQVIHGDLNASNFIWEGNSPRVIDTENLCFSKRISEFIPILLFKGNFDKPKYLRRSMEELVKTYDLFTDKKITELEKALLADILKLSLIKLYAIYNIRRNNQNEKFEEQIVNDLKLISEDSNAK